MDVAVGRVAAPLEPIEPGADIGSEVSAMASRAHLALKLTDDPPHGHVAGQEHGVDKRGEGLGRPGKRGCRFGGLRQRGQGVPDHPLAVGDPGQREGLAGPKRGDIIDLSGRRNKGRNLEILISGLPSPPVFSKTLPLFVFFGGFKLSSFDPGEI